MGAVECMRAASGEVRADEWEQGPRRPVGRVDAARYPQVAVGSCATGAAAARPIDVLLDDLKEALSQAQIENARLLRLLELATTCDD